MGDRRTHGRLSPIVLRAEFTVENEKQDGYLTNMSEGGAFLATDQPPKAGTAVQLRAVLPWGLGVFTATAKVRWVALGNAGDDSALNGAGLLFDEIPEDIRRKLDKYLDRFAELAAKIDE